MITDQERAEAKARSAEQVLSTYSQEARRLYRLAEAVVARYRFGPPLSAWEPTLTAWPCSEMPAVTLELAISTKLAAGDTNSLTLNRLVSCLELGESLDPTRRVRETINAMLVEVTFAALHNSVMYDSDVGMVFRRPT